jgi:hypothetical protein
LVWTVMFTDETEESVIIGDAEYDSDDHLAEAIAQASTRPDDVDDYWEPSYDDNVPTDVPNCGHHHTPLTWLGREYQWRCPACFPELFPSEPVAILQTATIEQLADEIERRGGTFPADLARLLQDRYMRRHAEFIEANGGFIP